MVSEPRDATRLMIIAPWGERLGGAETFLWTVLQHVDRARLKLLVAFLRPGAFQREVADLGIRTAVVPAGRLRQLPSFARTVRSLSRLMRTERPHVVLNWTQKSQLYGSPAAILAGIPDRVIWWQHGVANGYWMDHPATLLPARAVGCASVAGARGQRRVWPRRATFVVHPGVAVPTDVCPDDRIRTRSHLGISADQPVVGIVGRLDPWKRHHEVLRSIARLRRRGLHVHGLVVGGDLGRASTGYKRYLHRLVADIGLAGAVTFTGHVPDAGPYIAAMDVLVNASLEEPFGMVILEAMARGVPVVAVDRGGPCEIIVSGDSGLLVPATGAALDDALWQLLPDADLRRRLADGGRRRLEERFSAALMAARFEAALSAQRPAGWLPGTLAAGETHT